MLPKIIRTGIHRYEGTGVRKTEMATQYRNCLLYTSGEASMTWDAAKSKFTRFKPFDDPLYRDLLELVFTHVREYFIVIDRDFIYEIGVLYLSIAAQAMIASLKNRFQEEYETLAESGIKVQRLLATTGLHVVVRQ